MAINWTKTWSASDDGTLLKGSDLGNIQTDIGTLIQNAISIQGIAVDTPVAGDDGFCLFYDHSGAKFDYKSFVDLTATQTVAGDKTFSGDLVFTGSPTFTDLQAAFVSLPEGSAPATAAGEGALYTKDTGGQPELFYREESSGNEIQITNAGALSAQSVEVFTTSGNWTCPTGVNYVSVTLLGGGGGAGGSDSGTTGTGSGGGGGATILDHVMQVTPGNSYAITVGAGGSGGAGSGTPVAGTDGGDSVFVGDTPAGDVEGSDYTLTAPGGKGGADGDPGGGAGGAGGIGNTDLNAPTAGPSNPTGLIYIIAGGAGAASNSDDGGGGGSSYFGRGPAGRGGNSQLHGYDGGLGAGGAGGARSSSNGGNGGTGLVILKYNQNGAPS